MRIVQKLSARGHSQILATHPTTLEITVEEELTVRGDCIIAVRASVGAAGLDDKFKKIARNSKAKLSLIIEVDGITDIIRGRGDPGLSFTHPSDLVVRKSRYVCPRTLMIEADKAAKDINRKIIEKLTNSKNEASIEIITELQS